MSQTKASVQRDYATEPLPISAVRTNLVQVFVNLLVNALQAMPESRSARDNRIDVRIAPGPMHQQHG